MTAKNQPKGIPQGNENQPSSAGSLQDLLDGTVNRTLQSMEEMGTLNLFFKAGYGDNLDAVLPQIPIEVVAGIAAHFPVELSADKAVDRAYRLLEMAASAHYALSKKQPYGLGLGLMLLHRNFRDIKADIEQEKHRLQSEEVLKENPEFGEAGPVIQHNGTPHFRYSQALRSLMPQVERVADREKRFSQWLEKARGKDPKEAKQITHECRRIKLLPARLFVAATSSPEWWKKGAEKRSKRQVRKTRTVMEDMASSPIEQAILLQFTEDANKRNNPDPQAPHLTDLIATPYQKRAVEKVMAQIKKPKKR